MIKEKIQKLIDWLDSRQRRERIMLFGMILTIIYLAWSAALEKPIVAKMQLQRKDIVGVQKQLDKLTEQSRRIIADAQVSQGEAKDVRQKRSQLEAHIANLSQHLGLLTSDLVGPQQINSALRAILDQQKDLTLTRLETAAERAELSNNNEQEIALINREIYKLKITISFRGSFFNTLDYLKVLESLEWGLFWDSLNYKVIKYPLAEVTLKLHVLATKKGLLRD